MKIIAVVVTYNGMKWYKRCFDSLQQSSIPVETVVIDNKSNDGTLEYIKTNYPDITLLESDSNLGFGKANNLGFKYAIEQNADFVFLLNQDAWVKVDTIERLVNKMMENPEFGILSPIHLSGDESSLDFNFSYYIFPDRCPDLVSDFVKKGEAMDMIYPAKFVNAALWLISRDCLNTIGGFDPLYPHYGEDQNYISRLEYHNYKLGIYPRVFGVHDRDKGSWRKELSFKKKKQSSFIDSLLIMTNVHDALHLCTYRFICANITSFVSNILRLSFSDAATSILAVWSITVNYHKIYKHREIAKKRGLSFL